MSSIAAVRPGVNPAGPIGVRTQPPPKADDGWRVFADIDRLDARSGFLGDGVKGRANGAQHLQMLLILEGHARLKPWCWPSNPTLAAMTGKGERAVELILADLQTARILTAIYEDDARRHRRGFLLHRRLDPDLPVVAEDEIGEAAEALRVEREALTRPTRNPRTVSIPIRSAMHCALGPRRTEKNCALGAQDSSVRGAQFFAPEEFLIEKNPNQVVVVPPESPPVEDDHDDGSVLLSEGKAENPGEPTVAAEPEQAPQPTGGDDDTQAETRAFIRRLALRGITLKLEQGPSGPKVRVLIDPVSGEGERELSPEEKDRIKCLKPSLVEILSAPSAEGVGPDLSPHVLAQAAKMTAARQGTGLDPGIVAATEALISGLPEVKTPEARDELANRLDELFGPTDREPSWLAYRGWADDVAEGRLEPEPTIAAFRRAVRDQKPGRLMWKCVRDLLAKAGYR